MEAKDLITSQNAVKSFYFTVRNSLRHLDVLRKKVADHMAEFNEEEMEESEEP
jgi:hypothetical protein